MNANTVSPPLAKRLKLAGLQWEPRTFDFFAIPDRNMEKDVFVISNLLTFIERVKGYQVVTFHGTAEWALDYLVTENVVWLPTESQLREILFGFLMDYIQPEVKADSSTSQSPEVVLFSQKGENRCRIQIGSIRREFTAPKAADAYAHAVLYFLQESSRT